jgi:hypothetical protein
MAKPTVPFSHEIFYRTMVDLGGGVFRAFWDAEMTGVEPIVLFDSPLTKNTLGLPVSKMSADAVRQRIRVSDELFEAFQEKACRNIFAQFSANESAA